MHHIVCHILPSVPSDSEVMKNKATAYEEERSKTIAENQARMIEVFKEAHISKGLPLANFEEEARKFVYGARQTGNMPTKKSKVTEEKETHPDPTYEPDADEMASAEDDLGTDEEDLNADNLKKKVVISSFLLTSKPEKYYSFLSNMILLYQFPGQGCSTTCSKEEACNTSCT